MNKLISLLIFCSLFIYCEPCKSQINFDFIQHLSDSKLKKEHWTYIHQLQTTKDTIAYLETKYHFQYNNDSLMMLSFENAKSIISLDSNFLLIGSINMLSKNNPIREKWFQSISEFNLTNNTQSILAFYVSIQDPKKTNIDSIPIELNTDFKKYLKAYKKKPLVALGLSIIPGLGELYIGNKKAFFAESLPLTILALQIIESVRKIGVVKPITAINTALFSGYYVSSFIGSYRDTQSKKIDTKHQLLINASNYYSAMYPVDLY